MNSPKHIQADPNVKIISYTPDDKEKVTIFFREIFAELGFKERASDYMDEHHKLFHLPDAGLLLLIKKHEEIIGTAGLILLDTSNGLIKRFYIKKGYRGTGIAQQLLENLVQESKEFGIKKLLLDVSKSNTRAIRFYEKNEFLPTTVTPREDWFESNFPEKQLYFYKMIE